MGKQVVAGLNGGLAQLGEHLPCKQGVESSNLLVSTKAMSQGFAKGIALSLKKQKSYLENRISKIKIQASVDRKWKHFRETEVMMKIETSKTI